MKNRNQTNVSFDSITKMQIWPDRWQDLDFANKCIPSKVQTKLLKLSDTLSSIVGFCSGSGVLEVAIAKLFNKKPINVISSDITLAEPKYVIPNHIHINHINVDANDIDIDFLDKVKSFEENPKDETRVFCSRAWHHYFTDLGKDVIGNVTKLMNKGDVLIDVASTGSPKFLKLMIDLHNKIIGKPYQGYHTSESYKSMLSEYKRLNLKVFNNVTSSPRSVKLDMATRYQALNSKSVFNDLFELTNQTKAKYQIIDISEDYDRTVYNKLVNDPDKRQEEILFVMKDGIIIDMIIIFNYFTAMITVD